MTIAELRALDASALEAAPLTELLRALWWEDRGDWNRAHEIAQDVPGADGSWVHAYLHRREGDLGNAAYWYARAGRPVARDALAAEWESIVSEMLASGA